jgi:uncharacterized protein with von Willebrand factor type A (vWA) domain
MDLSLSRRELLELLDRMTSLVEVTLGRSPLLPASLYELKSRCGKPQCKCAQTSYRHQQWCISYVEAGASRTRTVAPELRPEVRKMTQDYRDFRQSERGIRKALEDLMAELERVREARCEAGRRRYEQLVNQHKEAKSAKSSQKGGE